MSLFDFWRLPEASAVEDLDSPQTSDLHHQIIMNKRFLRRLYYDLYADIKREIVAITPHSAVVEIGSGGGIIKAIIPWARTSDIFPSDKLDHVCSAQQMPFSNDSVDAFVMLNVFHHLSRVKLCIAEMSRCLRKGGRIIMIEPANTPWQRFMCRNFHHEIFDANGGWDIEGEGRLSAGNGALPWIIFTRDKSRFHFEFSELKVKKLFLQCPFRYILSGGLSYRSFFPHWMYSSVKLLETILSPVNAYLGFFQLIVIEKVK